MAKFMVLNPKDNVAVAVVKIMSGDTLEIPGGGSIKALKEVPFAHKIAVKPIAKGEKVYKYGEVIGKATENITAGQHVHVHNIQSARVGK